MSVINLNNTFRFLNCDCRLVSHHYSNNGSLAVQVVAADTQHNIESYCFPGSSIAWLSLNADSPLVEEGEFVVKTYSENQGLFEAVIEAALIEDTGKRISVGFNDNLPIVKLK